MKKRLLAVFSILLLFLPLLSAQTEVPLDELCGYFDLTAEDCAVGSLCQTLIESGAGDFLYDSSTDICYFLEDFTAPAPIVAGDISQMEANLSDLNTHLVELEQKLTELEEDIDFISQQMSNVNINFQGLNQRLNTQLNTVSTGLAGLQNELSTTQSNLAEMEGTVSTASFLFYSFLIVLIAAIAYGVYHFITKNKTPQKTSSQDGLVKYFSFHLKKGLSHKEIKKTLRREGWSESVVNWAHQKASQPSSVSNRNKIIVIAIGSIVLLAAFFFLISGTSFGKAIYIRSDHTIEMVCEEGKILTPDGFSCCTDANNNSICDIDEVYEQQRGRQETGICLTNQNCVVGKYCIDKECRFLHELGNYDCPQQTCKFVSATISTSDGETYYPVIGRGGYTAAGALDWTLLDSPELSRLKL
jgi:hypothetical protein